MPHTGHLSDYWLTRGVTPPRPDDDPPHHLLPTTPERDHAFGLQKVKADPPSDIFFLKAASF